MIEALIQAGGSLLGGLFNKPPSAFKQTRQGVLGQAAGAREASEQYGFNPLTLLGVSSPLGMGSSPMMGSAISDAFTLLADGIANRPGVGQKEALTRENADLRERLTRQTLHPKEPSIYGRQYREPVIGGGNVGQAAGAVPQAVPVGRSGAVGGRAAGGAAGPLRPLPEVLETDPRRETEHDPARTHSGFMTVDNPSIPFRFHIPTLDGDEGLQWYDLPSLAVYGIPQAAFWAGGQVADAVTIGRQRRAGRTSFRGGDGRLYAQQPDPAPRRYRPPSGLRPEHIYGF